MLIFLHSIINYFCYSMKRTIIILLIITITPCLIAQSWVEMMNDRSVNFYDVQQEFNNEWDGKEYEKGKGYKQYKRWEYFMEQRVSQDGTRPSAGVLWSEMEKYKMQHPSDLRAEPISHWVPLGPSAWTSTGWNPGIGRVNCIEVDPTDENIVYIGTPAGGCWKSIDGGNNWVPLTDNQPVLGVSAIAISYVDPNIIYIGTGDDDGGDTYSIGVLKSTDGGQTWDTTGLNFSNMSYIIYDLEMDPGNANHILAGTNGGVYYTLDGGDNWTLSLPGTVYDIEFKADEPATIYICNGSVWKSTNGGISFNPSGTGLPSSSLTNTSLIAVTADNPDYIYFLCGDQSDNSFYGLYRSTDEGATWDLQADSPNIFSYAEDGSGDGGQSWYDMALAASPVNAEEIYIGGINVWKSNDGGETFDITSHWVHPSGIGYTHADIHVLETFGDKIYCGSDGGVFKSNNGASNWVDITFGLQITQFYGMGSSEAHPDLIIAGAQDNGTNLWENDSWTHVIGADGMEALIDWYDPQIMYGSIQNGSLQKSDNGGASFSGISNTMTDAENANWVTPYDIDPADHNTLYAGYENLWKSTDGGDNWFTISNFTTNAIDEIAIAPSDPNFIYVSVNSILRRTHDGGNTWTTISNSLPGYNITDIAVDPESQLRIWVTFANYADSNKVSRSDDGGITWTNISGSLPNIPANCIAAENGNYNGVYIGMDVGIFYTNDTIADWLPYFESLPNVIVNEIEVNNTSGKVRAATYGRGIWESNMYTEPLLIENNEPSGITQDDLKKMNFIVYPNPSNGEFAVHGTRNLLNETIYIYDNTGKLLFTQQLNSLTQMVSLTDFPSGIYLIKINQFKTRIIKQ